MNKEQYLELESALMTMQIEDMEVFPMLAGGEPVNLEDDEGLKTADIARVEVSVPRENGRDLEIIRHLGALGYYAKSRERVEEELAEDDENNLENQPDFQVVARFGLQMKGKIKLGLEDVTSPDNQRGSTPTPPVEATV